MLLKDERAEIRSCPSSNRRDPKDVEKQNGEWTEQCRHRHADREDIDVGVKLQGEEIAVREDDERAPEQGREPNVEQYLREVGELLLHIHCLEVLAGDVDVPQEVLQAVKLSLSGCREVVSMGSTELASLLKLPGVIAVEDNGDDGERAEGDVLEALDRLPVLRGCRLHIVFNVSPELGRSAPADVLESEGRPALGLDQDPQECRGLDGTRLVAGVVLDRPSVVLRGLEAFEERPGRPELLGEDHQLVDREDNGDEGGEGACRRSAPPRES